MEPYRREVLGWEEGSPLSSFCFEIFENLDNVEEK